MEKISPKWFKCFLRVFIPLALITCLAVPVFADFAGDGVASGSPIYPDNGFDRINISWQDGTGGSNAIDNITYSLIPMYSDGSLTSEVARGVYGLGTGQFYRYTTLITRSSASRITQKQTFDAPLYSTATKLRVTYHSPKVNLNTFDMLINAVTDNTSGTCRITNISASYKELITQFGTQSITDGTLVNSDSQFVERTYSNVPVGGSFPFTFSFGNVTDSESLIIDLSLTFDITILDSGIFSLSTTSEYFSIFQTYTFHDDITINNITQNIEYVNMDRIPFFETIINTMSDVADIELFGAFTIGHILWAFLGIGIIVVFLKFFAGG